MYISRIKALEVIFELENYHALTHGVDHDAK